MGGPHLDLLAAGPQRRGRGRCGAGGGDDSAGNADSGDDGDTYGGEQEEEKSGTLDADGKLQITVPTKVDSKKQDLIYRIEARVTDAGNREISGRGFALATYGSFFLTAEPNSYVYTKGSTATINVTAQDYDKKPVQTAFRRDDPLELAEAARARSSQHRRGRPTPTAKRQVKFAIPDAGEFRVRIVATTPEKREVETTAYLWAPGDSAILGGTEQERIQIVADKKSYQPGDTAHVLIVTGKEPTSVLVTAEGNGLYSGQVIQEQRRQRHRRCSDQGRVRAKLLCRRDVHPRQQAL